MPPRLPATTGRRPHPCLRRSLIIGVWSTLIGANAAAWIGHIPWLPTNITIVLATICAVTTLTSAVNTAWARWKAPVEAALIHGRLLAMQEMDKTQELPRASGDTATVVAITRQRRPTPRPTPRHARH